jgi:hypothetical protein
MTDIKYHGKNAFCHSAGPFELDHLHELIEILSDKELKQLVENVGIEFLANDNELEREDYERVIDEADREDFYREYKKILTFRK